MRVPPITPEQAPLSLRGWFERGQPGALTATLAHVPELLETVMPFVSQALNPLCIDEASKEMAILRTSSLQGCDYCVQSHTVAALDSGLSPEQVRALRGECSVQEAFPAPCHQALIDWTEAVAMGPGPVPSEPMEALNMHFEPHQVVELTLCIAATVMLNRYCTALKLPVSEDCRARLANEGFADGREPS